jgi:trigger factor
VAKNPVVVTEEEVEERLRALQDSHAQLKPVEADRPVQAKDFVIIDFEGSLGGKPLEGWKVNDHLVEAGSNTLVGGMDQQFIGLPRNEERSFPLDLPEDYPRKELAGKKIDVRLRVKEIKEKILPPLDDDFAKEVGEFQNLPELRDRLRKNLAEEKIVDFLRAKHPVAIPKGMVDRQVQNLMARTEFQMARQGMKLDRSALDGEKIRESLAPTAEKEVQGSLILEKIAEKEKISVLDTEVEQRLQQLATQMSQRVETVKSYYQKDDRLENLRAVLLEEKTLEFLLSKAKIIEGRSTPPEERK